MTFIARVCSTVYILSNNSLLPLPLLQVSIYLVQEAFNLDKGNVTLKAMTRLTTSHLDPYGFEKMMALLACQIFDDLVLQGMHHYNDKLEASYGKRAIDATESFFW